MASLAFLVATAPSVTLHRLTFDWTFQPLPIAALAIAVTGYFGGVRRLARHGGRQWPVARTLAFVAGCAVVVVALLSGVASYDTSRFSVHVVQHLLLSTVAALLFALSAPVTLALQASSRPTQRKILRVLHSRVARVVGHPATVVAGFGGTMFVLYFTDLYSISLRHPLVHDLVHLHFLAVGALFFWVAVGIDTPPRPVPYGARLLLVLATVPLHAFLGIALLSATTPTFAAHSLGDQHAGAGILWAVGDLITLIAGGVVLAQWMAHEERVAAREDRLVDSLTRRSTASRVNRSR